MQRKTTLCLQISSVVVGNGLRAGTRSDKCSEKCGKFANSFQEGVIEGWGGAAKAGQGLELCLLTSRVSTWFSSVQIG